MAHDALIDEIMRRLINGDRPGARAVINNAAERGVSPRELVCAILWPAYEKVEQLHRHDQLTTLAHRLATRLLRVLADQAAARYDVKPAAGRRVFAFCGPTDADELGAEMAMSLLEAEGFDVRFAGGGVARDEILAAVQETKPDVLLLFASAPCDLPDIRTLIDTLDDIGACRNTQIIVGGGVFNRAAGLAEEIGADLWAETPGELCELMRTCPTQRAEPEQRTVGRRRRVA